MNKKRAILYTVCLICIYVVLKSSWSLFPRVFETLELQSQDGLVRLLYSVKEKKGGSPDIIYLDLDDKSLPQLPYSKNDTELYSRLISILKKAGVAIQVIDMVFVTGKEVDSLVQSTKEAGNVYLPLVFTNDINGIPDKDNRFTLPPAAIWKKQETPLSFPAGSPVISNMPSLNSAAAGLGHINCWPDHDGVYRRLPLFFISSNTLIPTLSLRVAFDYLQVSPDRVHLKDSEVILQGAKFPDGRTRDISIPFNKDGKSRINFIGPWPYVFAHYSLTSILERGSDPDGILELRDELEGSLVIISDVTTGGRDFGPLPFSSYSPLSGLHAQFLNSILTNNFLQEAPVSLVFLQNMLLLLLLVVLAFTLRGFKLIVGAFVTVALLFLSNLALLSFAHILFPLIRPTTFVVLGATTTLLIQFISIQQEKRVMKARLAPYFAPSVMEKILVSPEILANVSKRELTIIFSDIVGFTSWASAKEAHEVHQTLNRYFQEMSAVIFSFEGTIDKFMGDGMLAFFGDPTPQEDHAQRAAQAALAMQKKTWELKKEWTLTGGMHIRIRIGIHTGEVVVGNMGSIERMDYTVIGSHVNLAQRLESHSDPDRILISQEVFDKLDKNFITSANGTIEAKGFPDPIPVYFLDRYQPPQSHTI